MANDAVNKQTRQLKEKYGLITNTDVFVNEKMGFQILTRSGIEKIMAIEDVKAVYSVVTCQPDFAAIQGTFTKDARTIQTTGSAKKGFFVEVEKVAKKDNKTYKKLEMNDGNTDSWYVLEIAEKRCMSRGVLKLLNLYQHGFFGEDESHDFKTKADASKEVGDAALQMLENKISGNAS